MSNVILSIPYQILLALKATKDDAASTIRFAAAIKLYEIGQLSAGAAAELAGLPKPLFLTRLAEYGVNAFDLSEDELRHDRYNA